MRDREVVSLLGLKCRGVIKKQAQPMNQNSCFGSDVKTGDMIFIIKPTINLNLTTSV